MISVTLHETMHRGQSPGGNKDLAWGPQAKDPEGTDPPTTYWLRQLRPPGPRRPQLRSEVVGATQASMGTIITNVQIGTLALQYVLILQPKHTFWVI